MNKDANEPENIEEEKYPTKYTIIVDGDGPDFPKQITGDLNDLSDDDLLQAVGQHPSAAYLYGKRIAESLK